MSSTLLATDRLHSPFARFDARSSITAYMPYGYKPGMTATPRLGFTGQMCEPAAGWYLLGNGHRAYNSLLMRFNSPDRSSPFGKGGINTYAYCQGDPVNFIDPVGRAMTPVQYFVLSALGAGVNLGKALHAIITWDKKTLVKKILDGLLSVAGLAASILAMTSATMALSRVRDNNPETSVFVDKVAKPAFYLASFIGGVNLLKTADDVRSAVSVSSTGNQSVDQVDGGRRNPMASQIPVPPPEVKLNQRNWHALESTSSTMTPVVEDIRLDMNSEESASLID